MDITASEAKAATPGLSIDAACHSSGYLSCNCPDLALCELDILVSEFPCRLQGFSSSRLEDPDSIFVVRDEEFRSTHREEFGRSNCQISSL